MSPWYAAVRRAVRRLWRSPAFAASAVATLAIGIGSTVAVFTLVDAVLLRPLPFAEADRLVAAGHAAPGLGLEKTGQSGGTFLYYREKNRTLEDLAVYNENVLSVTDRGDAERIDAAFASVNLFSVLRARPHLGRTFVPADGEPDAPSVAVISHAFWVRRYGADPGVIGRRVDLNRDPAEIVGVMPAGFAFPQPATAVWYNMPMRASKARVRDLHLSGIGRLRPGVTPEDAAADLQRLVPGLSEAYPDATPELLREAQLRAAVVPFKDVVVGDVRLALMVLACTAGFVLLITWANVANLFFARAEHQRKEIAVERALGARGVDLGRRFVAESVVVSLLGAALGMLLAYVAVAYRFGFSPGVIPRLHEVGVSGGVLAFTAGLSLLTALLLAAVLYLRAGRPAISPVLRGGLGGSAGTRAARHTQRALVALQVALALTLLIGSAMMAQSFWRLRQVELGFQPRSVLTFEIALPARQYFEFSRSAGFHHDLAERLRGVPGVLGAEAVSTLPLTPSSDTPEGVERADAPGRGIAPTTALAMATAGYFRTMGIPVRRGRGFAPGDLAAGVPPVVLSEELARAAFGGDDPVGREVRLAGQPRQPAYRVIGVVGSVPGEAIPAGPARTLYFPALDDLRNRPDADVPIPLVPRTMTFVVRTSVPPASLTPAVRRIVASMDPQIPVANVRSMEEIVDGSVARMRLTMVLLLFGAGAALFLGVVGIYGVVSYTVSQRTPELGVRIALGARPAAVTAMVLRQGVLVALAGVAAGVAAALGLTGFLAGLLFGIEPGDPATFAAMAVFLLAVATAASYLPARRAARIDPAIALRAD
jgi:predicted permease